MRYLEPIWVDEMGNITLKNDRETNFELLRIVAMVMIVSLHYWGKSGFIDSAEIDTPGFFLAWIIRAGCFCAVNCYVLLSGYFMSKSKFRFSKVVKLWLQVFEYSVIIYLFTYCIGVNSFSLVDFIKSLLPISTEGYWFATKYLLLLLLSPFLNLFVEKSGKVKMGLACIILLFVFSACPTILCYYDYTNIKDGYSLTWFITLYLVAAYIRKYGFKLIESKIKCIMGYCCNVFFLFASKVLIYLLTIHFLGKAEYTNVLFRYNAIFPFMASLFLFGFFRNIIIRNSLINRIILALSPFTFGVYLIHMSPYIIDWFWVKIVDPTRFSNIIILLIHYILVVFVVYTACSILEMIRKLIFERAMIFNKYLCIVDIKFEQLYKIVKTKLE